MTRLFTISTIFIFLAALVGQAQEYPFSLPSTISATININTSSQELYNNLLLGTNIHEFTRAEEQEFINHEDPITIRFPHGLWSNWYDWRTDETRLFGEESFQYDQGTNGNKKTTEVGMLATIRIFESLHNKIGIDGLSELNAEKKEAAGKGYDMLWTFNMSVDGRDFTNGSPETIARYRNLRARGFEVKAIELGNECFYPSQRSSIIPNATDYIKRAKSMSAALKQEDANIKVSIPLLRKDSWANPNWNIDLTKDTNYFDAVTVHTYVGADPDDAANGDEAYGTALSARKSLASSINNYARKVAPTKPIWLSEWGVKSGGANAVSALGMADCYIYMSENQDVFERANWFSVNGQLNSFLVWHMVDVKGTMRPRIKYPLQKTAFGATYEIIREVFENSTLLESTITSPELLEGVNAISAKAVCKNGELIVFVVNLSNREVPFDLSVDDTDYTGTYKYEALAFSSMGEERVFAIDDTPITLIQEGSDPINLPKFSLNTIVLNDAKVAIKTGINLPEISKEKKLSVCPNPIENNFAVSLQDMQMNDISIYNLNGQLVYNIQPKSKSVQLEKGDLFTNGIYVIKVIAENQKVYSQKLIFN